MPLAHRLQSQKLLLGGMVASLVSGVALKQCPHLFVDRGEAEL